MHLLDWGIYGGRHSPPLTAGHLETWLGFCRDDLEGACPPDARILAYLGLVSDEARHPDVEKVIAALRERTFRPEFDLVALPALGNVVADDLIRFLVGEGNSSCPPAFVKDLSERIVRHTGGSFEATVKLLEETERGNRWYELDEELPKVEPRPDVDKDTPL
jgi:hypothetical protein